MFRLKCFLAARTNSIYTKNQLTSFCNRNPYAHNPKNFFRSQSTSTVVLQSVTHSPKSEKLVGKWLLGCSAMVFGAVVLGGVTRLTESGLSMVTWKLLGEKRPRSQSEWEEEFKKYQQFPEFKMKNSSMDLKEFKFIYTMEYVHRMWGRAIGAFFFLPAAYFWTRGHFCGATKKKVLVLGALLGAQGLMGWYMVKSGLEDRFQDVNDVPRVSQYRLATHLGAAFVLYMLFLSTALNKILPASTELSLASLRAHRFRKLALLTKGLVFVTAISGAFVAGLDAGLVYNSFPKMGDNWIPDDILSLSPMPKNITENPTTVQFDHRILGISTLCLVSFLWLLSRRTNLPKRSKWAINSMAVMVWLQATLGVTTLLNHVPVPLAAAHQSGSLLLLSFAVWLTHELRFIKYIPK